jgi:hypothetical protein
MLEDMVPTNLIARTGRTTTIDEIAAIVGDDRPLNRVFRQRVIDIALTR